MYNVEAYPLQITLFLHLSPVHFRNNPTNYMDCIRRKISKLNLTGNYKLHPQPHHCPWCNQKHCWLNTGSLVSILQDCPYGAAGSMASIHLLIPGAYQPTWAWRYN